MKIAVQHILKIWLPFVTECGADVGLAFDGDADRVLAVDENGQIVDGDKIMTVIGLDMKKKR